MDEPFLGRRAGETLSATEPPDDLAPVRAQSAAAPSRPWFGFVLRDAPYIIMLVLALGGVGYAGITRKAIVGYWDLLAPVFGVIVLIVGWQHAPDRRARIRLAWTQALHWLAFLVAMRVLYMPTVRGVVNTNSRGLDVLVLLALGTFVAGVHALSWRICVVGAFLALAVPAIAWLEQSVLLVALGTLLLLAVVAVFWWAWKREPRAA
jgi:hypothetical protein